MSEALILEKMNLLENSLKVMAQTFGARLTREELAKRFNVSRSTLSKIERSPNFPDPIRGKYLLSEIMEWELRHSRS